LSRPDIPARSGLRPGAGQIGLDFRASGGTPIILAAYAGTGGREGNRALSDDLIREDEEIAVASQVDSGSGRRPVALPPLLQGQKTLVVGTAIFVDGGMSSFPGFAIGD
jgi:hypothetical protein